MTATLPADVREAFERFVTTELTTVDRRQQPITWPVTPYYRDGAPTIDITTGLGYPKKADDARRHPRIALLFSDHHGSGIASAIQVLVQGIADVDEQNLDANRERYARESAEKLPATASRHPPKFIQRSMNWYYSRIYVKVRPERVLIWRGDPISTEPEIHDCHLEEVRSGRSEEPAEEHAPAAGGPTAWDGRIEELGRRYETAVLSWVGPDGFPLATRLPVALDVEERRVRFGGEAVGLPLTDGRACLTAHRHDAEFTWQENFQVRGDLVSEGHGWTLVPRKLVGGFELPKGLGTYRSILSRHMRFRRTAKERLAARE